MYQCPLHNWSSYERPCPTCYPSGLSSDSTTLEWPDQSITNPCPECESKDQEISSLNEILSQKMELLRKANERIEELEKQLNK